MGANGTLKVVLAVIGSAFVALLGFLIYLCRSKDRRDDSKETGMAAPLEDKEQVGELEKEELITFQGGEKLTIHDILDAPGEVVGKSGYGTLYKANLERSNAMAVLRFLRPACTRRRNEIVHVVRMLGVIRHPNLVPLHAFYSGPRGEKLLVHPFYSGGTLEQFLRQGGNHHSHEWPVICKISTGIVKAIDHLHTGLQKPVVHGNLKSKNILLDAKYQPYVSDFYLHLLLNPTTGQEMLEASASQGYKPPELIKMRDVGLECDIHNLGIILLEILTGRPPINENPSLDQDRYLPDSLRNVIIHHRVSDIVHPDLLANESPNQRLKMEERLLMFVQLAMACCSPSPYLRPHIKQVRKRIEEITQ